MTLLGVFLLLQGCWEVGAEIGGRHIRRITAADLPSSNSTDATKVKLKKLQVKELENCTKVGSCSNPTTEKPHSKPTGKTVSTFLSDNVLQGRPHTDVLSYLTTRSPYDGGYGSYFDGDDFNDRTAHVRKKSSFDDEHHSGTEAMHFDAPLTTPRIKLFDDFHARMTEGIRQNLEEMDKLRLQDVTLQHGDKVLDGHQTVQLSARLPSPGDPIEKTTEEVALEFLSNFSVVYNDTKMSNSARRDVVVENGTHIDFERSRVYTKLDPEVNRTIFFVSNDTLTEMNPASELVLTDSKNGTHRPHVDTAVEHSKADAVSLESLGSSERLSPHVNTTANKNVAQNNNTGTPGDKDSTTSESVTDRSISKSHETRNYTSVEEDITVTSDMPITRVISNETKSALINIGRKNSKEDAITSSSSGSEITKDPKSNTVSPLFTERTNRGSKMLVSTRDQHNSTNVLEQSSQNPLYGSSENSYSSDDAIKKPRARYNLLRPGTNRSEEQVQASTASVATTTEKTIPSTQVTEDNGVVSQAAVNARNIQKTTNPTSEYGFTEEQEGSTVGYVSSSRRRTHTYRRPYKTASVTTSENFTADDSGESTVTATTSSPSVTTEAVRRRMTPKRRLQTSTEASAALTSSSNLTTESNVIVIGLPIIAKRTSLTNETDNNEGNDIISVKNNVYKPEVRNRGSVRYGSQKSDASEGTRNASSTFSTPPTSVAWTLVTLMRPDNETRALRQDNSTSDANVRRWPPTRGRRPWNSEEQGKQRCSAVRKHMTLSTL